MITLSDISMPIGKPSLKVDAAGEVVLNIDGTIVNDDITLAHITHIISNDLPKNIYICAKIFSTELHGKSILAASVFVLAQNTSSSNNDRIGISGQTFQVNTEGEPDYMSSMDEPIRQELRKFVLFVP